jgi:hypothetical protein
MCHNTGALPWAETQVATVERFRPVDRGTRAPSPCEELRFFNAVELSGRCGLQALPKPLLQGVEADEHAIGGRAISEGLRQEAGDTLRVTIISPGMVRTNFAKGVTNQTVKAQLEQSRDTFALPADAIARAIASRSNSRPMWT